jgi:hypothetical protein
MCQQLRWLLISKVCEMICGNHCVVGLGRLMLIIDLSSLWDDLWQLTCGWVPTASLIKLFSQIACGNSSVDYWSLNFVRWSVASTCGRVPTASFTKLFGRSWGDSCWLLIFKVCEMIYGNYLTGRVPTASLIKLFSQIACANSSVDYWSLKFVRWSMATTVWSAWGDSCWLLIFKVCEMIYGNYFWLGANSFVDQIV